MREWQTLTDTSWRECFTDLARQFAAQAIVACLRGPTERFSPGASRRELVQVTSPADGGKRKRRDRLLTHAGAAPTLTADRLHG